MAWLVWHLTRVEDDHVADVAGVEQVWTSQDWYSRFGLPVPSAGARLGSHRRRRSRRCGSPATCSPATTRPSRAMALDYAQELAPTDLDRIVDERWDPPVSLGVRLVSVVNEVNQHLGQAAYLRGLVERGHAG